MARPSDPQWARATVARCLSTLSLTRLVETTLVVRRCSTALAGQLWLLSQWPFRPRLRRLSKQRPCRCLKLTQELQMLLKAIVVAMPPLKSEVTLAG